VFVLAVAVAVLPGAAPATAASTLFLNPSCMDGGEGNIFLSGTIEDPESGRPLAGQPIVFYFDGVQWGRTAADENGQFSAALLTPGDPLDGTHEITSFVPRPQLEGPSATLTVPCPLEMTADPVSFDHRPNGEPVQLDGRRWPPNVPVTISLDGVEVGKTESNSDGFWTIDVDVTTDCGQHEWRGSATNSIGRLRSATAPLTVTGCPSPTTTAPPTTTVTPTAPPTTTTTAPLKPPPGRTKLTLSPVVISGGYVTIAHGEGFRKAVPVRLVWAYAGGVRQAALCGTAPRPEADGTFDASCLVLAGERQGPRTLVATQPGSKPARASALVVENAAQPDQSGHVVVRR
jgi:hypothetical protein